MCHVLREVPYEEALAFATEEYVTERILTCEALLMSSFHERVCSVVFVFLFFVLRSLLEFW